MTQKWYRFSKEKGSRQKLPPLKRDVLGRQPSTGAGLPQGISVGYRKNAGGDKQCPFFVVPGIGGEVLAWCDCLPDDFEWPEDSK
jgi:hypothetical protein